MKNFWLKKFQRKRHQIETLLEDLQEIMALNRRVFKLYGRVIRSMKMDGNEVVFELEEDVDEE